MLSRSIFDMSPKAMLETVFPRMLSLPVNQNSGIGSSYSLSPRTKKEVEIAVNGLKGFSLESKTRICNYVVKILESSKNKRVETPLLPLSEVIKLIKKKNRAHHSPVLPIKFLGVMGALAAGLYSRHPFVRHEPMPSFSRTSKSHLVSIKQPTPQMSAFQTPSVLGLKAPVSGIPFSAQPSALPPAPDWCSSFNEVNLVPVNHSVSLNPVQSPVEPAMHVPLASGTSKNTFNMSNAIKAVATFFFLALCSTVTCIFKKYHLKIVEKPALQISTKEETSNAAIDKEDQAEQVYEVTVSSALTPTPRFLRIVAKTPTNSANSSPALSKSPSKHNLAGITLGAITVDSSFSSLRSPSSSPNSEFLTPRSQFLTPRSYEDPPYEDPQG